MDSVREILERLSLVAKKCEKELAEAFKREFGFEPRHFEHGRVYAEIYPDDELKEFIEKAFGISKDLDYKIVFDTQYSFLDTDHDWTPAAFTTSFYKHKGKFCYGVRFELEISLQELEATMTSDHTDYILHLDKSGWNKTGDNNY